MNIILDTNVFYDLFAAEEEATRVYAKIIRDCDKVIIDSELVNEYTNVLTRHGFTQYVIQITLTQFAAREKLRLSNETPHLEQDIITHEKDMHLIECAKLTDAKIITYEKKHLSALRNEIKAKLNIDIMLPREYLNLSKSVI
jgi:predicted nucleic acid-binding protein